MFNKQTYKALAQMQGTSYKIQDANTQTSKYA